MSSFIKKAVLGLSVIFATSCQMSEQKPEQKNDTDNTAYETSDLALDVKIQSGSDATFFEQTKYITMNGQSLQYKSLEGTYSGMTTDTAENTTTIFNKALEGAISISQGNVTAVAIDSVVINDNKLVYVDGQGSQKTMALQEGQSYKIRPVKIVR